MLTTAIILIALADVRYVDASATPGGNGQTWASAYDDLQEAIDDASADDILVADGIYAPITLRSDLLIIGGIGGESAIDAQGASHAIVAKACDNTLVYNFSIRGGNSSVEDYGGGGAYIRWGSPEFHNCTFSNNSAGMSGGAVYLNNCEASFAQCGFRSNRARYGGHVYTFMGSNTFTSCIFAGGVCELGAGIFSASGTLLVDDCLFSGARAEGGAGIYANTTNVILSNSDFVGLNTTEFGGAIMASTAIVTANDCVFSGNAFTSGSSSVVYAWNHSSVEFFGCQMIDNEAPEVYVQKGSTFTSD